MHHFRDLTFQILRRHVRNNVISVYCTHVFPDRSTDADLQLDLQLFENEADKSKMAARAHKSPLKRAKPRRVRFLSHVELLSLVQTFIIQSILWSKLSYAPEC